MVRPWRWHVTSWRCLDGNEAVALVAHRLSDVCAIYPITPASPMGEFADAWSAAGRPNLWGSVPHVMEMQSEAGAAGALHGALQKGVLATTFTSSQGLLLMLPNMYKIAGELTPAVIHVAARALATHALSIFGDHSDVMAARGTGWAMLCASSVQETHDFALVSHAATLRSRVPFLHFFDGFRTSHEVDKIALLDDADLRALVRPSDVLDHRSRGLTPERPVLRGSAQNPDVFFQAREAANPFYDDLPQIVQDVFDELGERTGRRYDLVDYHGAADAERVVVVMGSGAGAVREVVDALIARGERVGMVVVRLYRPFPAEQLMALLPDSVTSIGILDRVKEPARQRSRCTSTSALPCRRAGGRSGRSGAGTASARRSSPRRMRRPCSPSSTPRSHDPASRSASWTTSRACPCGPPRTSRFPRRRGPPSSTAWAVTERWGRTRPVSRSSARTPICGPRGTSSTTRRSPAPSRCPTCASAPTRSTPRTSSTTPTSWPATSSACSSG